MEIDCSDEATLNKVIKLLKVDKTKISHGPSAAKYEMYYGISQKVINEETPSLTFKNIGTEIVPLQNKKLFNDIVKIQKTC
jgi:hypothetical protein